MRALGIHWTMHDNAAALVVDGEVVAAVEEERLSRQKHAPWVYPRRAIDWCLARGGIDGTALDVVAVDFAPLAGLFSVATEAVRARSWRTCGAEVVRRGWATLAPAVVARHLGRRVPPVFVNHQRAHAATAWFSSGMEPAAVLVVDGMGDFSSAAIFEARVGANGPRLEPRWVNRFPRSLGLVYAAFTAYLGFRPFSDEYKVMGLAAYGRPRFSSELARLVPLGPDGGFDVDARTFTFARDYSRLPFFDRPLEALLGPRRGAGEALTDRHADIASSLQMRLEDVMLALAAKARALVPDARVLCLAGGVALNCAMNGRLRREGPFERVFCGPAPHDAGAATGAALVATLVDGADRRRSVTVPSSPISPFLGPDTVDGQVAHATATSLLPSMRLPNPTETAATLIAAGHPVAWMQGRVEMGPRALGNRSILADPRDPKMPQHLNQHVKQREEFRPFAPAVLLERAAELFELDGPSPYMQFAVPVRPPWRERIPAVTHVDGTARVQTVSESDNALFRRLLVAFERRTGVPCVLNTSFNSHGEPMVATPEDALACFGRTGLRFMIMGDRLVAKSERDLAAATDGAGSWARPS